MTNRWKLSASDKEQAKQLQQELKIHPVICELLVQRGITTYEQAKQFAKATEINALAITKLDGTAKGGVVIGISDQMKIPVKYIGVGEGIDDLQVFNKYEFVDSLFKGELTE